MKRSILAGLSGLVLSVAIAPATLAEVTAYNPNAARATANQATPFELVSLANQGYLKAEGISSQGNLVTDYLGGRVDANTVVQAAIRANRVSADAANNQAYVNAVDAALKTVVRTY
jgi:gamma-glutamyl:cysteine ligase YbdK (ATP-grasp superfamily)